MKKPSTISTALFPLAILCALSASTALAAEQVAPSITERGPHHRIWTRTNVTALANDRWSTNISSYTELGSGMHRWDSQSNAWVDAEAIIQIEGNTAVARKTAHQVTFAANANTPGAITLVTPDGKTLRSHVLGVAWHDTANGRNEMIGELKDSAGELHPPNVVLYPDAFDGLKADLRYTQRLGDFEQDVILRENPPLPDGYAPDTTRLEVWTEFIEAPASTITQRSRSAMVDDTLNFGAMQTGAGKAFVLGDEANPKRSAPVAKRWLTIEGRTFLVESVRYQAVAHELNRLPAQPQAKVQPVPGAGAPVLVAAKVREPRFGDRAFPSAPRPRATNPAEKFRTAAVVPPSQPHKKGQTVLHAQVISPSKGFVLDYTVVSSAFNYTFQGDTTYHVTNTVYFEGTVIVEGGTVVKFAKTNIAQIVLDSAVGWHTDQYRPAIFTAADDNTVGEILPSSTGTPSGYYGNGLRFTQNPSETIQNVRLSHLGAGISVDLVTLAVRHAQFVKCSNALSAGGSATAAIDLENILFYNVPLIINGETGFKAWHVTINQCNAVANTEVSGRWAIFYNSIILDEPSFYASSPTYNNSYAYDSAGDFQTVGAAAHYLAAGSPHRNAGTTTGLSATLIADIKKRTTFPPVVIVGTGFYTNDLTLSVQAGRDTDTPDLGYHYDPIDFALSWVAFTNARVELLPGTAVATFSSNSSGLYGFVLGDNTQFNSRGLAANPNHIVRYNTVQEQANTSWTNPATSLIVYSFAGGLPSVTCNSTFTKWCTAANDTSHIYVYGNINGNMGFRDCQFFGGSIALFRPTVSITNCLFHRNGMSIVDDGTHQSGHSFRNSLFYGGYSETDHCSADAWVFRDNVFANHSYFSLCYDPDADYNAYTTNLNRLNLSATHDKLLATSNLNFQVAALGRFYLPTNGPATNLLNTGSTYATNVGLYHYTTTTNQVIEGVTTNDIGFHYVAVGSNLLPVDTDSEGVPDYLEDANGNGVLDHRETKVNDAADGGLRVFITRPKSGSTIP